MVMEVETYRSLEDSTLSAEPSAPNERVPPMQQHHCRSPQARDTSTTCRDSYDDVRQSLSHYSILNLTSDAEDEDDDEEYLEAHSFLFDEANQEPLNSSLVQPEPQTFPEDPSQMLCCPRPNAPASSASVTAAANSNENHAVANESWLDTSIEQVTETFVETLCPSSSGEESCGTSLKQVCEHTVWVGRHLHRQVELDILALLGCPTNPSDDELDAWVTPLFLWAPSPPSAPVPSSSSKRPFHRGAKERAERIRQWRTASTREQHWIQPKQSVDDLSVRPSQSNAPTTKDKLKPIQMLLDDDPLGLFIGKGLDPIQPPTVDHDLGYDSDPEVPTTTSRVVTPTAETLECPEPTEELDAPTDEDDYVPFDIHRLRVAEEMKHVMASDEATSDDTHQTVQETLNYTWMLTWHPASSTGEKPVSVETWIERGSLLNFGSTVVEPRFMWRHSFHPELLSARKLHHSSQKPFEVRLLNACRIVEATQEPDRTKYPLARTSCSFYLRTCLKEEFLFEAASPEARADVVHQWRLVVARMASLAVVDDLDTIALEFFTPVVTSEMLTMNLRSNTF